ncbi:MAG: site-2 protease family protein [Deltaproteobacteria bacterium]|nr:site-2 protease family protein [Deltaproteobacteria bacterium]
MLYGYTLGIIGLLILIHELGHLTAARLAKIPVQTFSVGFGPRLAGFTRKGVDYRLSLILLGGYLKPGIKTEAEWSAIPPARRVAFTLGGIIANGVAAVLLLTVYGVSSRDMGFFSAQLWAGKQAAVILLTIFTSLPLLFTNSGDLAGIIGIVAQGSAIIGGGQAAVLLFAAILSLNLAAINLLPLPPLDGGRALFDMLGKVAPPLGKASAGFSIAGWIVLVGLTILATKNDLARFLA